MGLNVTGKSMYTNELGRLGRWGVNQTWPQWDPGATHSSQNTQTMSSMSKLCCNLILIKPIYPSEPFQKLTGSFFFVCLQMTLSFEGFNLTWVKSNIRSRNVSKTSQCDWSSSDLSPVTRLGLWVDTQSVEYVNPTLFVPEKPIRAVELKEAVSPVSPCHTSQEISTLIRSDILTLGELCSTCVWDFKVCEIRRHPGDKWSAPTVHLSNFPVGRETSLSLSALLVNCSSQAASRKWMTKWTYHLQQLLTAG